MKLVVMKFGGTSVGSIDKINNVANIVEKQLNDKKLIVVLSAMSGVTNKMQEYIDEIESNEIIENDLILTSGEAVSVGLLSAILKKRNIKSIPLLGWQIPIITDSNHQKAKILNIDKVRIDKYLNDYDVLVVADEKGEFGEYLSYRTWDPRPIVGTQGLKPTSWHRTHEQWGATQMQNRFRRESGRWMTEVDYHAWTAVRALGETITRTQTNDVEEVQKYLLGEKFGLGAYKGVKVSFRPWNGQLRQPVLLAAPRSMVSVSPQEGYIHPVSELDTLGKDQPESSCKF